MSKILPTTQVPGIYRRRVGDAVVTAISDGLLQGNTSIFRTIESTEIASLLGWPSADGAITIAVNAFLVQTPDHTILIDTGAGTLMGPGLGLLLPNLAAAGVTPGDIDMVLLTHLHIDHYGGLLDADGKPAFPNARLLIPQAEADHWFDDAKHDLTKPDVQTRVAMARRMTAPYGDRTDIFAGTTPVAGIEAVPLPGHTPGHTSYGIGTGPDRVLIWGDVMHVPPLQSPRPDATLIYDLDPAMAAATRQSILARAADDHLMVAGMHLHFPAFAHIVRRSEGYELRPVLWSGSL